MINIYQRTATSALIFESQLGTVEAVCDPGDRATGGGHEFLNSLARWLVATSRIPEGTSDRWRVVGSHTEDGPQQIRAIVVCADLQ